MPTSGYSALSGAFKQAWNSDLLAEQLYQSNAMNRQAVIPIKADLGKQTAYYNRLQSSVRSNKTRKSGLSYRQRQARGRACRVQA